MQRLLLLPFFMAVSTMLAADAGTATSTTAMTATGTGSAPATTLASGTAAPAPRLSYSQVHVDGPYIAMTFDDGPSAKNTGRLLDILAKRHIHATFFLIGQNAKANPDLVKREVAEGHEIGNHSWTHPNLALLPDDKVRAELQQTDDAIFNAAGIHPKLLRPPYGSLALGQKKWVAKDFGYKIILWDVDPLDWKIRNAAHVESEILKGVRNGSIILSHDIHSTTVDAMPDTLDQLLARGFKFVTVSELIAMQTPVPPPAAKATAKNAPAPAAPATVGATGTTQ